ncbi:MAG TPA: transcriptional repressor LexA [Bryobacteraceae bacterium]|nr:transcriptional repressor LexA [Bryobacteraceae bacterium]
MALTPRQKQVLDFIADYIDDKHYNPSYEEIARGLDLASLATVHKHVQALQERKYLRKTFNHSRSLEVSPQYLDQRRSERLGTTPGAAEVPLAGRIAAGSPVEAIAGQDTLAFRDFCGKDGSTFALEVRGDSMIEDHICSGDYVLVEKTAEVRNGEIVVALVGGSEATLKRFYREADGRVRLQPANASMAPIFVEAADLQVQGRVISVMRKYR